MKPALYRVLMGSLALALALSLGGAALAQEDDAAIPGTGLITGPAEGEARNLTGTGATFPNPLYERWIEIAYTPLTGVQVNYQPTGSSAGIRGATDGSVNFGGSDAIMTDEQLAAAPGGPILHIPAALGGVVPTYNIPELDDEALNFTPETLCLVFLGEAGRTSDREPIIRWNDPRLVADNPALAEIDRYIVVVHRAEGSGTTEIFTNYLTAVCPDWAEQVGAGPAVNWPTGIGARGNAGVAGNIAQTPYTIGYVEQAYAATNQLPSAAVQNREGNFVRASQETISLAAAGFDLPDDMRIKLIDAEGENAYPISGLTWLLVYENQTDPEIALALARFLWWATHDGQQFIIDNADDPIIGGYAPLPLPAIQKAEQLILRINVDGVQALPTELAEAAMPADE